MVSGTYIDSGWVPNTSTAQWIVAPGAKTPGGTANVGGPQLPGNGTTGNNDSTFVYQLAFNITGTGSGAYPRERRSGSWLPSHVRLPASRGSPPRSTPT